MTPLFFQIMLYSAIAVWVILPFTDMDNGEYLSPLDVCIGKLVFTFLIGIVPFVNSVLGIVLIANFVGRILMNTFEVLFSHDVMNFSLRKLFKRKAS